MLLTLAWRAAPGPQVRAQETQAATPSCSPGSRDMGTPGVAHSSARCPLGPRALRSPIHPRRWPCRDCRTPAASGPLLGGGCLCPPETTGSEGVMLQMATWWRQLTGNAARSGTSGGGASRRPRGAWELGSVLGGGEQVGAGWARGLGVAEGLGVGKSKLQVLGVCWEPEDPASSTPHSQCEHPLTCIPHRNTPPSSTSTQVPPTTGGRASCPEPRQPAPGHRGPCPSPPGAGHFW